MQLNTFSALILLLSLSACVPGGADPDPETAVFEPDVKGPSNEAGRNLRHIRTADHLMVDLVAAEPFLANPVSFDIDVQGDIYVAEAFEWGL